MKQLLDYLKDLRLRLYDAEMQLAMKESSMDEDNCEYEELLYESIKDEIFVCEEELKEMVSECVADAQMKKEEKEFKALHFGKNHKEDKRSNRRYASAYEKAERNKRKKRAAMKRSFAWTVI